MTVSDGSFLPMETSGTQHLVNRTYRESGPFQWRGRPTSMPSRRRPPVSSSGSSGRPLPTRVCTAAPSPTTVAGWRAARRVLQHVRRRRKAHWWRARELLEGVVERDSSGVGGFVGGQFGSCPTAATRKTARPLRSHRWPSAHAALQLGIPAPRHPIRERCRRRSIRE